MLIFFLNKPFVSFNDDWKSSVMAASAGCIRNAVALRDACYVRVSSRVPDVLGRQGLLMEDTP